MSFVRKSHEIFCTLNICYFLDCIILGDISDFEIEECVISGNDIDRSRLTQSHWDLEARARGP